MSTLTCPICKTAFKLQGSEHLPFCSVRCKNVDLGRWLDEEYSVPHEPSEDELEAEGGF